MDTLEYGANIDNKAFLQADDFDTQPVEVEAPKPQPKKVVAKEEVDPVIAESQAALDDVQIKTPGSKNTQTNAKPLMPSADASKDTLDATFSYKPKPRADIYKPKKKVD
jgi:hypothetical protein